MHLRETISRAIAAYQGFDFDADTDFARACWGEEADVILKHMGAERVVRHLKRGTTYEVAFQEAEVQADEPIVEGDRVAVYVGNDGKAWVRRVDRFNDGRFEIVG